MVISYIRLQLMEINRCHDNDPRSIGELFYSLKSSLTAITFTEAIQTLPDLLDDLANTLNEEGVIAKSKLAKEIIEEKVLTWYSRMSEYIKMYIQPPTLKPA